MVETTSAQMNTAAGGRGSECGPSSGLRAGPWGWSCEAASIASGLPKCPMPSQLSSGCLSVLGAASHAAYLPGRAGPALAVSLADTARGPVHPAHCVLHSL